METSFRKTEKVVDGKWIECSFESLKKGDCFRLFEPTGEIVKDNNDNETFLAVSEIRQLNGRNFAIDADPVAKYSCH